ncbi:hypothetical protein H5410_052270 [Solanum commersonii]|uniref:Uncharacterized protein n=1 Tax=Solanum commersonii TaxID=4109 RepID=A0A9J5X0N0_SOLCO|nr:hypothetical protein H5410_052270 [Solanum commersonii]
MKCKRFLRWSEEDDRHRIEMGPSNRDSLTGLLISIEINRIEIIKIKIWFHPISLYTGIKLEWIGTNINGISTIRSDAQH